MSADFFDYDELDPGIRSTVALLNSLGFNTCDSGDGRTKIEKGEADGVPPEEVCAENEPNVYMTTTRGKLLAESDRLRAFLLAHGLLTSRIRVEASYSPIDGVCVIALHGLDDTALRLGHPEKP